MCKANDEKEEEKEEAAMPDDDEEALCCVSTHLSTAPALCISEDCLPLHVVGLYLGIEMIVCPCACCWSVSWH